MRASLPPLLPPPSLCVADSSLSSPDEPSFSISREPVFGYPVVAGMTVTLKCEIDANPWCRANWIKDTSKSNISIADMESPPLRTEEEGSFTILSAKQSDSGWYRCVCDHELGVDGHSASYGYFLNVRCKSTPLL